mmetsp:Transcript_10377/g.33562  ORF Transcript_10377/g.33562 Transcript_10377/m.33562 type:complete len:304 (+) Transcript_10377:81-992(+)
MAPSALRPCGSQGLMMPPQGLGCMGMTAFYVDDPAAFEEQSKAVIKAAPDVIGTPAHLDTAWIYRGGAKFDVRNEKLVGDAIKENRDKYIVATKFGFQFGPEGMKPDSTPAAVRACYEDSMAQLGCGHIDLFYQHRLDPNTPIEETMEECKKLIAEGKIKYVGLSEAPPDIIRRAHKVCPISCVQQEWSLQSRDLEADIVPVCRELGIGIVAYSPLGRGMLAGAFKTQADLAEKDWRKSQPRTNEENFDHNAKVGEAIRAFAEERGHTPGQVCLAWVHSQGPDVFPIPGTKSLERLKENAVRG